MQIQRSIQESIQSKVHEAFLPVYVKIENESHMHRNPPEAETHFKLILVSDEFDGLQRVERHRAVMSLLDEERARGLHALTLRVFTSQEWSVAEEAFNLESPPCFGGEAKRRMI